jgi:GNAT superfamily N-acetyltransferase
VKDEKISVLAENELSGEFREQIAALNRQFFPENLRNGKYLFPKTGEESRRFLYLVGDRIASHILVIKREIQQGGKKFWVGMVGEICTREDYRHRGYAQALLQKINGFLEQEKLCLGILFCLPEMQSFYEQAGWEMLVNSKVLIGTPEKTRHPDGLTMVRSKLGQDCIDFNDSKPVFFGEPA